MACQRHRAHRARQLQKRSVVQGLAVSVPHGSPRTRSRVSARPSWSADLTAGHSITATQDRPVASAFGAMGVRARRGCARRRRSARARATGRPTAGFRRGGQDGAAGASVGPPGVVPHRHQFVFGASAGESTSDPAYIRSFSASPCAGAGFARAASRACRPSAVTGERVAARTIGIPRLACRDIDAGGCPGIRQRDLLWHHSAHHRRFARGVSRHSHRTGRPRAMVVTGADCRERADVRRSQPAAVTNPVGHAPPPHRLRRHRSKHRRVDRRYTAVRNSL